MLGYLVFLLLGRGRKAIAGWWSSRLGVRAQRAPRAGGRGPQGRDGAEDEGDGGAVEEGEGGGHPSLPAGEEEVRGPD